MKHMTHRALLIEHPTGPFFLPVAVHHFCELHHLAIQALRLPISIYMNIKVVLEDDFKLVETFKGPKPHLRNNRECSILFKASIILGPI